MARPVTQAQRAAQITFVLKGHADLDSALGRLNAASGALARTVRFANPRGIRLAAVGGRSLRG
jgi:hypothetical protein